MKNIPRFPNNFPRYILGYFLLILVSFSCQHKTTQELSVEKNENKPYLYVLGTAQDAGFPQAACSKSCCAAVWKNPALRRSVVSLGLIDQDAEAYWMLDATPDFPDQYQHLLEREANATLKGIFLTHAHIGHYTGLMHLGREVMGAQEIPVYAMPRMHDYLQNNGPWSQLVSLKNIDLQLLKDDSLISISAQLSIQPILVPHRDEFSETVGYWVKGPQKSALFIPDIDKWEKWEDNILDWISRVDYALLDGSFFKNGEIPGRDMALIPHPFIEESLALFKDLPAAEKDKVYFIHFNHTNPVLNPQSAAFKQVHQQGFHIAEEGMVLGL